MRELNRQEVYDILLGATVLGTGGGGSFEEGIRMIDEAFAAGKKFVLADFDEVEPDTLVGTPYACGAISPLTEEDIKKFESMPLPEKDPTLLAFEALEKSLGQEIPAVISTELGGENTACAFFAAAMNDRIILDGDPAGRAVPSLQHSTYYLDGIPMYPMAACTNWGEAMVINYVVDDMRGEDLLRAVASVSQNVVYIVDHVSSAKKIGDSVIKGAITKSERVGKAFREAVESGNDMSEAVLREAGGKKIFSGTMKSNSYETIDGYTYGDMYITGEGEWEGHEFHIWYQNENIMSYLDGEICVSVPELIVVLNHNEKFPQLNPMAKEGDKVDVLCLPADKPWMTKRGLEVFGPKSFGFENEWVPFLEYEE